MGLLPSPSREVYQVWGASLSDFSETAIKRALIKSQDVNGFFNLPAFRELCRVKPQDLGLPDAQTAYREACTAPQGNQHWSHPAVYHAADQTGWFELRSRTEREIFPLFELNYSRMVDKVMAGESLDVQLQKALPEKVFVPASEQAAQDAMSRINAMFGAA
jgi:hypothetical protein